VGRKGSGQGAKAGGVWVRPVVAFALLLFAIPSQARAAKMCGWFVETVSNDNLHTVEFWVQADAPVHFLFRIEGKHFYTDDTAGDVDANPAGDSTYALDPGEAESIGSRGQTLDPGGHIDFVVEIRARPHDLFDKSEQPPRLGAFFYRRTVTETDPPTATSPHACFEATFPGPPPITSKTVHRVGATPRVR
jgi:hypothetical protein